MLQVACTIVAGFLLFVIARQTIAQDRVAGMIVAGGLLLRAIAGQAIFWISYLHLPIASHLQIGNGLWFFGQDGQVYLTNAIDLSEHGLSAIMSAPHSGASVAYVQALSTFVLMLGQSTAVGLLLNLFSYQLTCSVIIWWARHSAAMRRPAHFALVALAASPAGILWSMQPLKDTFFQFLVVAFVGGAFAWNTAWTDRRLRSRVLAMSLLAMTAALFAIAGVRWYFAFAVLLATGVFFLHVSLRVAPRPVMSLAISGMALFLLSRAFLAGAGPYAPAEVRTALLAFEFASPAATPPPAATPSPAWAVKTVQDMREGFVRTGGATSIASEPLSETSSAPVGTLPTSNAWLLGLAATFIPSSLHTTLGLPGIAGGRGMLWLADIDTLFFGIVMVVGLAWCVVAGKRPLWSNSVLILVLLITLVIGAPLVYMVTNFGTLFRLRGMLLVTAAMLPLAAASGLRRHSFGEEREHVAPRASQGRNSLRIASEN